MVLKKRKEKTQSPQPSAIYDLMKGRTKCSKVITVKRFCEGAGIAPAEFFDRPFFHETEE